MTRCRCSLLTKLVEIVGEAAKQVTPATRAKYPAMPWTAAARMRDRLVHHYFDIDLDVLWSTVAEDLPALLAALPDAEWAMADPSNPASKFEDDPLELREIRKPSDEGCASVGSRPPPERLSSISSSAAGCVRKVLALPPPSPRTKLGDAAAEARPHDRVDVVEVQRQRSARRPRGAELEFADGTSDGSG